MSSSLLLALALLSSVCGMAWLALAMKVHWQQVRGNSANSSRTVRLLRVLGVCGLTISLLLCLSSDHGSIATLVWIMSLAASLTKRSALSPAPLPATKSRSPGSTSARR